MRREVVLDLETQDAFSDVGGSRHHENLRVSVCGLYLYERDEYIIIHERNLKELEPILQNASRLVGFNIKGFDIPVLKKYLSIDVNKLRHFDILEEVRRVIGRRVSLSKIAKATLNEDKLGDGLDAIKYFRQGKIDLLEKYCLQDVKLTKEVYEYGLKNKKISFMDGETAKTIGVDWSKVSVAEKLLSAFNEKKRVLIEYPRPDNIGPDVLEQRKVDVYHLHDDYMVGFCHLRRMERTFRVSKIKEANIVEEKYDMPLFDPKLWQETLKKKTKR